MKNTYPIFISNAKEFLLRYKILITSIFYTIIALILCAKLYPLWTIDPAKTWDGPGHLVLIGIFADLSKEFIAEGYVSDWFGGFPAFRFYPTFFAFLGSIPVWLGFDIDSALFFAVLISFFVLSFGYYYLASFYLSTALSLTSLLFYLSFAGLPQLGVSVVGFWGGNYPSILGTGLTYLTIGSLVRRNYLFLISSLSLLAYTHYLGFMFCSIVIFLFILFNFNEVKKFKNKSLIFSIILPILIAIPSFYGILFHSHDSSGENQFAYYPFIETIIGGLKYSSLSHKLFLEPLSFLPIFFSFGIILSIRHSKSSRKNIWFLIFSWFIFLFMVQDISITRMLPESKIHFYRAWDLLLGFYFLLGAIGIANYCKDRTFHLLFFAISILYFLSAQYNFDYKNPNMLIKEESIEKFFKSKDLEVHSEKPNVYIETTASGNWNLSPHISLEWLYKNKIPSDNGLMLESSWTGYVYRLYLPVQNPNDFQWAFSDPKVLYDLPQASVQISSQFLASRSINYLVAKTESFSNNFQFLGEPTNLDSNIKIYPIENTLKNQKIQTNFLKNPLKTEDQMNQQIIGLISKNTYLEKAKPVSPKEFFVTSYLMTLNDPEPIYVDMNPNWNPDKINDKFKFVDKIYVYDPASNAVIETLLPKDLSKGRLPLSDFKYSEIASLSLHKMSYFTDIEIGNKKVEMYRTHMNQILYLSQDLKKSDIQIPKLIGRIKMAFLILIFISWMSIVSYNIFIFLRSHWSRIKNNSPIQ